MHDGCATGLFRVCVWMRINGWGGLLFDQVRTVGPSRTDILRLGSGASAWSRPHGARWPSLCDLPPARCITIQGKFFWNLRKWRMAIAHLRSLMVPCLLQTTVSRPSSLMPNKHFPCKTAYFYLTFLCVARGLRSVQPIPPFADGRCRERGGRTGNGRHTLVSISVQVVTRSAKAGPASGTRRGRHPRVVGKVTKR